MCICFFYYLNMVFVNTEIGVLSYVTVCCMACSLESYLNHEYLILLQKEAANQVVREEWVRIIYYDLVCKYG